MDEVGREWTVALTSKIACCLRVSRRSLNACRSRGDKHDYCWG